MGIAIVTGASSGMGKEFVLQIAKKRSISEIWIIARRRDKLEELQKMINKPIRVMSLDLCDKDCLEQYSHALMQSRPDVSLLVNCSGFGRFGSYRDIPVADSMRMIELNCKALVYITETTLPYMSRGARIIELASCSAFQPLPYLNVYAATKAFVLHYTQALNNELKPRKIKALAVCPTWVRTEFIDTAEKTGNSVNNFAGICRAEDVVKRALFDSILPCKDMSVYGIPTKLQHAATKFTSHKIAMFFWKWLQNLE